MKKIRPLGIQVLVKPSPDTDKTEGGIILAPKSDVRPAKGVVISVANGTDSYKMTVEEGDTVLYNRHHRGKEIDGNILIPENEIVAIL